MTADYSVSQLCTLPETAYSTSQDTGSQIVIASTRTPHVITSYDAALRMGERPVIVDIRTGAWKNISRSYFRHGRWRSVPLDDMFGEGRYDKILAVPRGQAPGLMHHGIHIATLPFTNSEFFEVVDAMADTYGLVTPALEDSS